MKHSLARFPAMPCATGSEPAFAGGTCQTSFALVETYRVSRSSANPLYLVLAQN
jgi:hypothetical protein